MLLVAENNSLPCGIEQLLRYPLAPMMPDQGFGRESYPHWYEGYPHFSLRYRVVVVAHITH